MRSNMAGSIFPSTPKSRLVVWVFIFENLCACECFLVFLLPNNTINRINMSILEAIITIHY